MELGEETYNQEHSNVSKRHSRNNNNGNPQRNMIRWHGKTRDNINNYNDNKCIRKMNEEKTDKMNTIYEGVLGGGENENPLKKANLKHTAAIPIWSAERSEAMDPTIWNMVRQ